MWPFNGLKRRGGECLCTYLLSCACVCMSLRRYPGGETKSLAKLSASGEGNLVPGGRDREMETWCCTLVFKYVNVLAIPMNRLNKTQTFTKLNFENNTSVWRCWD